MEEQLPAQALSEDQREVLRLLCRAHELEGGEHTGLQAGSLWRNLLPGRTVDPALPAQHEAPVQAGHGSSAADPGGACPARHCGPPSSGVAFWRRAQLDDTRSLWILGQERCLGGRITSPPPVFFGRNPSGCKGPGGLIPGAWVSGPRWRYAFLEEVG